MGYTETRNVDFYHSERFRNVRIIRVDMLEYMTDYFTIDTIRNYRDVVYNLVSGKYNSGGEKRVQEVISILYDADEQFRIALGKLIYFPEDSMRDISVYNALLLSFRKKYEERRDSMVNSINYIKYLADNRMYSYISISNASNVGWYKNNVKGLEVVSK